MFNFVYKLYFSLVAVGLNPLRPTTVCLPVAAPRLLRLLPCPLVARRWACCCACRCTSCCACCGANWCTCCHAGCSPVASPTAAPVTLSVALPIVKSIPLHQPVAAPINTRCCSLLRPVWPYPLLTCHRTCCCVLSLLVATPMQSKQ